MVSDVEDLNLEIDVKKALEQLEGVIVNQGRASVHEQEVGEEILATEVQQVDIELHKMARDHVPFDGEEDEE